MNEIVAAAAVQGGPYIPMTFSQVLDRIWMILRGRFLLFLQLGLIPAGVMLLVYGAVIGGMFALGFFPIHPETPPDPQRMMTLFLSLVLPACIPFLFAYALFEGAATIVAMAANRAGTSSFTKAYGAAWKKAWRIVWLLILRGLAIMLPMAVLFAVFGGLIVTEIAFGGRLEHPGLAFVLVPMLVLCYAGAIVYAVWMHLRLALAVPACLDLDLMAWEALKRSAILTRGAKGRMFLVMLVEYAISYAAIFVIEMVGWMVSAIVLLAFSGLHVHLAQPWAGIGIGILAVCIGGAFLLFMALTWAAYAITFSVLYDDQRMRLADVASGPTGGMA